MKKSDSTAKENAKLAAKHNCDARTIRRWRAAGAPLDDPETMGSWLATRKHIPPRTATLSAATSAKELHSNSEQPAAGSRSAYERLQAAELAAHGRVIQLQDGDPIKLKAAVQNWLMINKERRQTEFHLTADERKANVMVNWLEVEQDLSLLGTSMHFAGLEAMDMVAVALAGESDICRCRILIRKCIPSVGV